MKKAKRTKRLLAGLLALLLAVTGVPLYGMEVKAAEEGELTYGDYCYEVNTNGNSVKIKKYNGSGGNVTIPDVIDGKPVTFIGRAAFSDCTSLTGITIPDSVTSIGEYAFSGCTNLANIASLNMVTFIDKYAFSGCTSLANFSIPDSVATIGEYAFSGCTSLTSITIPNKVRHIQDNTFKGCSNLEELTILDGVISIVRSAFDGCNKLTSITVSEGNNAYDSRGACNSIIETESNTLILGCKNTIIPDNVTSIGWSAFEDCIGLTSITIPNSVSSIDGEAFNGCSSLTGITIPNSVSSIGQEAFYNCSSLASITIPSNVSSINAYAFGYIHNPYDDENRVKKIEDFTIYGVTGSAAETYATKDGFPFIAILYIPDAEITLEGEDDGYVWDGTPITPAVTVTLNGKTLTQGTDYTVSYHNNTDIGKAEVTVTGMGDYLGSQTISFQIKDTGWEGDFKYKVNEDGNSVTILKYDGADSKASIPETIAGKTVTIIDKEAFSLSYYWGNSDSPTNLTIPASVTSIGSKAFYNWRNLKSITIPSTVTSIGEHAFGFYEYEMDPDDGGDIIDKKAADFSINGEPGSAAEAYAAKYGFPFNGQSASGNTDGTSQNGGSQADISKAAMTLEKDSYTYDGKAKTPAVTVTLNGKTLTLNTDYTVAYTNNINVGTAKATVTGKGNYKGSVTKTFSITKANNSAGNNGTSDGNGSAGTSNPKQPITCKKRAYTVAYGTKPFKLKVTSNGSLTYKSSNSKIAAVGKTNGKVTIKNTGITYITAKTKTDSVKITIKVRPAKPKVKSLSTGKNRKLTVKWAKDKRATGYQVQISTSKNFKKNVKKQNTAKTAYTFKKLKAGSKYYVRLRSFKKSVKTTLYSAWSSPKQSGKIKR